MANTHTAASPECRCRRPIFTAPVLCRCTVLWPCPSHIGRNLVALDCVVDPLALAVVVLWCILPRHVAPELVIAEPEFRPIATPFFTPNQTLGSPRLCHDACCRATVHHRPPFFVPLPGARHQFRLAAVATSTMSCLCAHPRSQGPVFWAGAPGQPSTRTNACE
jgi:hypothetical protein